MADLRAAACTLIGEHLLANVDIQMADLRAAACTLIGEHLLANVDIQMADLRAAACTLIGEHLLAIEARSRPPKPVRRESFWSTGTEPVAKRPATVLQFRSYPYPTRDA
jgi:hypothetical protein